MKEPLLKDPPPEYSTGKHASTDQGDDGVMPHLSRLGRFLGHDEADGSLERIGKFLRWGSLVGLLLWGSLMWLVHYCIPEEYFECLGGTERNATIVLFVLLVVTNGSRILPLIVRRNSIEFAKSGVMMGLFSVEIVSIISAALMIFAPTPVMVDPVSGIRMHLVRFGEWCAEAFIMTFLTESIDLPLQEGSTSKAWVHGLTMFLSCTSGLLFPFCEDMHSWLIVMITAIALFMPIFSRLFQRRQRLMNMDAGTLATQRETYIRALYSYRLMLACTVTWTMIVVAFCVCCALPRYAPPDSMFADSAVPLITEHVLHSMSKIWYLSLVVDVNDQVFDESARACRRLEDLRNLMSAIWDNSTDVLCRCVQTKYTIDVIVSPAFMKLERHSDEYDYDRFDQEETVILQVDRLDGSFRSFTINLSKKVTREDIGRLKTDLKRNLGDKQAADSLAEKNLTALAALVMKACDKQTGECEITQDFYARGINDTHVQLSCEALVTSLETGSVLVLLRDISERFRRFEAERRLVEEAAMRRKDAQANRFSRHEIKNGLLAAIGLSDSLEEAWSKLGFDKKTPPTEEQPNPEQKCADKDTMLSDIDEMVQKDFDFGGCLHELANSLREVLGTVLDEVMCRELVYEEYIPKKEAVDVPSLLSNLLGQGSGGDNRFPVIAEPKCFPRLKFDPQLLRYIHRNTVSNACKYGMPGGKVETKVCFDVDKKWFKMEVTNLPGPGHEKLALLSKEDAAKVFAPQTQLRVNHFSDDAQSNRINWQSSGDGAWIMQQCAKTLGGLCSIRFETTCTVFTFQCPGEIVGRLLTDGRARQQEEFRLPRNTWGIAIDDSGIQRKLLERYLKTAGIQKDKMRVFGSTSDDVYGFCDMVEKLVLDNPNDTFLLVVDENLDVIQGGALVETVSGSQCIRDLRDRLKPDDEKRLLALVRSANDSSEDILEYKTRAHGVLEKAPAGKGGIMGVIRPLWEERFPAGALGGHDDPAEDDSEEYVSREEILAATDAIDGLLNVTEESSLKARWAAIREKLYALKVDLNKAQTNEGIRGALNGISGLLHEREPDNVAERWDQIKLLVRSMV